MTEAEKLAELKKRIIRLEHNLSVLLYLLDEAQVPLDKKLLKGLRNDLDGFPEDWIVPTEGSGA